MKVWFSFGYKQLRRTGQFKDDKRLLRTTWKSPISLLWGYNTSYWQLHASGNCVFLNLGQLYIKVWKPKALWNRYKRTRERKK